ncbi:MAG: putative Ig domain-containing protein, partial [Nitrospirae bacterium]|nr:putative Ig domain-containing protein [Nitrospirota bacterium]
TAWFEWGTSTSYGLSNSLTPESILAGTTAVNLTPYTITGLTAYTAYHYRAVAKNTGGTAYGADALFTTLPLPPVIIGSPTASPIFQTTATLNGTVLPNGAPGQAFFNYGLTATYGSATSATPISGSANMAVSILVGNLTSLTTYHYQMVAYNTGGTAYGPDAAFTTLAYPPSVITDYATNIGPGSASLNGQVNTNGLIASAWFEWGVTTSYGTSNKSTAQLLNPGTSYVILTPVSIGSLLPNAIYHFRAVAESSAGITTGVDRYFTTQSGGISPPGLSYSPDPGYNSVIGYTGTNPYTFKVVYTSPSNLPPSQIGLYLDWSLTPLTMTLDTTEMGTSTTVSGGPVINITTIKDGIAGLAYSQIFTATGGNLGYEWSMTAGFGGTLPAGLSIDRFSGVLSGTPAAAGTYPITITVKDITALSGSVNINLIICSYTTGCQYQVAPPTSPTLLAGVGFYFFGASDGQSTISLSSSGTLAGPTIPGTPTSTPVGNNVVVTPTPGYAVNYPTVSVQGSTTLSSYILSTYPIPSSYTVPITNIYYQNISSTAVYSGNIYVCINYSSAYFINQNAIVMLHYEGSKWVDRTSSLDVVHNIACGVVTSLPTISPFALVMTGSTAVGLTSFTTTAGDGKVMIEWNTQTETNQLGFNILRGLSINGPFTQINSSMVPARGNSIYGSHYRFMDYGVSNGATYYYKLESLDTGSHSVIQFVSSATPHSADIALAKESLLAKGPSDDTRQDQPVLSGKGTGLSIIQTLKGEKVESGDGANVKPEDKTTTPLNLIQVNSKVMADKVILSWIPMDASDSYTVWRSEEKNGFYEIISDKLISPEVRGNMDENDYLIRCVYEDKAVESGKTYYYKIERMALGSESEIVGAISVKVVELSMKNEGKEAMGLQLHQPVVIEHQNKKEPTENQSGTH